MTSRLKNSGQIRRQIIVILFSGLLACPTQASLKENKNQTSGLPQSPMVTLGPFYQAVQSAKFFPDQKTFADAIPDNSPILILSLWRKQKNLPGFNLLKFVNGHFTLPSAADHYVPLKHRRLREHINELWPILTRNSEHVRQFDSLLPLPHPYIVPGGRFREAYYWDTYFTMLGLGISNRWDLVQSMIDNFAHSLDTYGFIPNGNRTYYLSRSQPPFFSLMVELLARQKGDQIYIHYLPQLKKEYHFWMSGVDTLKAGEAEKHAVKLKDGTVLNRYWDARNLPRSESYMDDITTASAAPERSRSELFRELRAGAESGWDYSSRWFGKPDDLSTIHTTEILPVDLNALLYKLETVLAYATKIAKQNDNSRYYSELARKRQQAINHYFWDDKNGWYADFNWKDSRIREQLTAATLFPLYLLVATEEKASRTAAAVQSKLVKEGGLTTSLIHSGQQWDAPNGWAPLQWVAVEGLNHYGKHTLAKDIARRFLENVQQTYDKEHKLVEKYRVEGKEFGGGSGGEYPLQDGFGWTNGVTLKLMNLYCDKNTVCNEFSDIDWSAR